MPPSASHDAAPSPRPDVGALPRVVLVDWQRVIGLALIFTLIGVLFLAWLASSYTRSETDHDRTLRQLDSAHRLRLASLAISNTLAGAVADLRYLRNDDELEDYLRNGSDQNARKVAAEYVNFLGQSGDYSQIRFIDAEGRERIRVDQDGDTIRIARADQLQDKSTRYYIQALRRLAAQQIYVSPMDLNVEHGHIELPYLPMIRLGLTVTDARGQRRGYLLINYRAELLLDKLRNLTDTGHSLWLLDDRGDWLLGPSAEDAWSGQLPERQARGFARQHPAHWQRMRQQPHGQLDLASGQAQFARVQPLLSPLNEARPHQAQPHAADSYVWYLITANPNESLTAAHRAYLLTATGLALTLLVALLSTALAYALVRQRALATTLANAVDNLPALVAYLDREQRFRFNNRAYLDTFGQTPKALYGQHLRATLGEHGYTQARPHLELALSGQRQDFELHLDTGSGPRELAVTYVPDVATDRQVSGVYVLLTDISLRKAAEQREHDQMLTLAQVSRLASVGEITSEIAHQLNQPLAAIAMFSNAAQRTLENGGDQSKLGEWMAAINTQAKRASEVIQRLRRFAHRGDIHTSAIDLNAAAREVAALAEAELRAAQVRLDLQLDPALPRVLAATNLLEQVIYNLLHNAIQACGPGGENTVTLRTWADDERVWLEVAEPSVVPDQTDNPLHDEELHDLGQSLSRNILASFHGDMISTRHPQGGRQTCMSLPRLSP